MSNFYKILFFLMVMISSLMAISSLSWITMWMSLEINLLCVIPVFFFNKNIYSSESSFKYFIIQALASTIFLFSMMMNENANEYFILFNNYFNLMCISSLMMKLGMAPFHFWFPEVMEGLSWSSCLILLTIQKLAPLTLLIMFLKPSFFLNMSIILSSLMGGFLGLNQISLRKIIAYSSINHMAWLIVSILNFNKTLMIYFLIYSISMLFLTYYFNLFNLYYIKQISSLKMNKLNNIFIMMNLLSLGGLPPFIGFLPKWLVIYQSINIMNLILIWILIISTLITLKYYMRLTFSSVILMSKNSSFILKFYPQYWLIMLNFLFLFSLTLMNLMI